MYDVIISFPAVSTSASIITWTFTIILVSVIILLTQTPLLVY